MNKLKRFFRDNFFSGLLVVAPVAVSVYIFYRILRWLYFKVVIIPLDNQKLGELLSSFLPGWTIPPAIKLIHAVEFVSVVFLLALAVSFVGLIIKNRFFKRVLGVGERVMERIPLLSIIYSALKQLMEAIFYGKGSFRKAVLVEFPMKGMWSVGFVSRDSGEYLEKAIGKNRIRNIFVPTTPNVTTGFLILAPEEHVIDLEISVDDAFKFIISGGLVLPHEDPEKLKAELENKAKAAQARSPA